MKTVTITVLTNNAVEDEEGIAEFLQIKGIITLDFSCHATTPDEMERAKKLGALPDYITLGGDYEEEL